MGKEKDIFEGEFNQADLRLLFDTYYKQVKNFLYYRLGDIEAAEDIAQESFVRVWEKRHKVNRDSAKGYLFTIANNLSLNAIRKQKLVFNFMKQQKPSTTEQSPLYIMEEKEFDQQLQQALSDLSEKQRMVFLMNRIDDLTYQEIADRLELSVKAVEKRMSSALKHLRTKISHKV